MGEPHDEPDGEEGDLVDVGCEGRHDAGNQEERVREQEGLSEKGRDGEMSIIFLLHSLPSHLCPSDCRMVRLRFFSLLLQWRFLNSRQ